MFGPDQVESPARNRKGPGCENTCFYVETQTLFQAEIREIGLSCRRKRAHAPRHSPFAQNGKHPQVPENRVYRTAVKEFCGAFINSSEI